MWGLSGQEIKVRSNGTKLRMTLKSEKKNEDYTEEQQKIGYVLQQEIAQKTVQCLKKIVLVTAFELKIGSDKGKENKQKAIEESCIFQQNSKFQA